MRLDQIRISRFRNISAIEFEPDAKLNFFVGSNGQGKTSILESVALLSSLKSFRDSKPQDWIQNGQLLSEIEAWFVPDVGTPETMQGWRTHFKLNLERQPGSPVRKAAQINGKPIRSGSGFFKQKFGAMELALHTISFNPSDHDLIRGEPMARRQYLDRVISAETPDYLDALLRYSKLIEQRNALLKEQRQGFREILGEFTQPLIPLAAWLVAERLKWLDRNAGRLAQIARTIAPDQTFLELRYVAKNPDFDEAFLDKKNNEIGILNGVHFAGHHPLPSLQELEHWMAKGFSRVAADELRAGVSLLGPHRDDWAFESQGSAIKGRGSQGEVRTALLALKLAEIESFRGATGHRPILLLDDFSSELDLQRRRFLMEFLEATDLQAFVTSTDSGGLPGRKFRIEAGVILPAGEPG